MPEMRRNVAKPVQQRYSTTCRADARALRRRGFITIIESATQSSETA